MEGKTIFMNISSDSVLTDTWDNYRIVIPTTMLKKCYDEILLSSIEKNDLIVL